MYTYVILYEEFESLVEFSPKKTGIYRILVFKRLVQFKIDILWLNYCKMWWLNDKAALSAKERSTCVDAGTAINS